VIEPDGTYDPDNEEPEEVPFNSFALENAVRRNMSIWRSHGMTGERRKYSSTDDDDDDDDEDSSQATDVHSPAVEAAANDDEWCCDDRSAAGIYTLLCLRLHDLCLQ